MNSDETAKKVRTAFLVFQREDGEWEATPNIDAPIMTEHPASVTEMQFGCSVVISDIRASGISQMVVQQMMAITAQINQQAQSQALREKLKV